MQPVTKQTLKIWWDHTKLYPKSLAYIVFGSVCFALLEVLVPHFVKTIVDQFSSSDAANMQEIDKNIWYIFGLGLLGLLAWRPVGYAVNYMQPKVMSDLLNTCFEYLLGHSVAFFNNNFAGSIVTRVRRYQGSYERFTDILIWDLGQTVLRASFILSFVFATKPMVGLILSVWSVIYLLTAFWFARYKLKFDMESAEQETKTTAQLADAISNSFNIILFGTKITEFAAYQKITDKLSRLRKKSWDLGNHANGLQGLSMLGLNIIVLRYLNHAIGKGAASTGDFVQIQAYMAFIFQGLWNWGNNIKNIYESLADANEMTEMLMEPHSIVDVPDAKPLIVTNGEIEIDSVKFHFNQTNPILSNFSVHIPGGQRRALVGPSGAGKSTIVKLLLRFEDVKFGKILIDGQDISHVTQESLRKSISYVPQEPVLFHRTLMENIRYGKPDASIQEVIAAAKAAHAHEFISEFPDGYETYVGERGVKLSGGEKQRVAIARALLKNAPILILDEATSSLDSESESLIQDALHTLMKGRTTIAIAHRLSTIREADLILVLENGRIVEKGTHSELIRMHSGTYRKHWEIQTSGYEMVGK